MLGALSILLPPTVLATGLYFVEAVWASQWRRRAFFATVVLGSLWNIFYTSLSRGPVLNFAVGLECGWYIIWAADILFILDPCRFQRVYRDRIVKEGVAYNIYRWQGLPARYSWDRLLWVLDLVTNLRELGWQHGLHTGTLPPIQEKKREREVQYDTTTTDLRPSGSSPFVLSRLQGAVVAHLYMSMYELNFSRLSTTFLSKQPNLFWHFIRCNIELWGWIMYLYCYVELFYSVVALVAVGLLGPRLLGTAGEPWMYPPIFGYAASFFTTWEIHAFWGRWWHNLLRRSFISIANHITVGFKGPRAIQRLLRTFVMMILSGFIHAAASYSVLHESWPAVTIWLFFCLLPIPMAIQEFLVNMAKNSTPRSALIIKSVVWCIGIGWVSWVYPLAFWNPAVVHIHQCIHVPGNLWPYLFKFY